MHDLIIRDSHPDLHPKGATEFLRIKAAYDLIKNRGPGAVIQAHGLRRTTGIRTCRGLNNSQQLKTTSQGVDYYSSEHFSSKVRIS